MAEGNPNLAVETEPQGKMGRFTSKVATFCGVMAAISLAAICILVAAEVVMRSLFGRSTLIADEISGYLNVAVVFFGLSYTITRGGFIRVEVVYSKFSGIYKRIADWFILLSATAYIFLLIFYMTKYTIYSFQHNLLSNNFLATPQYIPQSIVILGLVGLAVVLVGFVVNRARNLP